MIEQTFETISRLPREELEEFAVRTALQVRIERSQSKADDDFVALLIGFMIGALVAVSGFLIGAGIL